MNIVDLAILFKEILRVLTLLAANDAHSFNHCHEVKGLDLSEKWLQPISLEHLMDVTFPVVHTLSNLDEKPGHLHKLGLL